MWVECIARLWNAESSFKIYSYKRYLFYQRWNIFAHKSAFWILSLERYNGISSLINLNNMHMKCKCYAYAKF